MVLYIDSIIRENSRTKILADHLISKLSDTIVRLELNKSMLSSIDEQTIIKRGLSSKSGDFSDEIYNYAKQLKEADIVVIAAPYYDLSFPSLLKVYVENICVAGITFKYNEMGIPISLCKIKKVYYVTTAGGHIFNNDFGYGYIKSVFSNFFGVEDFIYFSAEELDVIGNDTNHIVEDAIRRIDEGV